ncbi:hypothetical protein LCGC14_2430740, partial [marine sediment metagenome]
VHEAALDGIHVPPNGSRHVIVGNNITKAGRDGVQIDGTEGLCLISGNTIDTPGRYGIYLTEFTVDNLLGTNLITGAGSQDIRDDSIGSINTDWLANPFYNGTMLETMRVVVTEAAGTVTMSIDQVDGGDLTMRFSDGRTILDTTPASTIELTSGSDNAPTSNFIYILQSDKILTKSTSDFPTDVEHIKVAFFSVPSAAFVAAKGVRGFQVWNDHAQDESGQGHMADMSEWIRHQPAKWHSGLSGAGVDDYLTIVGTTVDLKIASGYVYQLHRHAISAFDTSTGGEVLVKNWPGDAWHLISNLYDIVDDSTGVTIPNNKYFNFVVAGVANKESEFGPLLVNVPGGSYNKQSDAEQDVSGHDVFTIPGAFSRESSTAFLICRITMRHQNASGGTWTHIRTLDLRGVSPAAAAGGSTGVTTTEFADNAFKIFDESDVTKVVAFQASGISTGTTRTLTVPDGDGTLILATGLAGGQTLIGGTASGEDLTLQSTAHATKGVISLADTLYVNEVNGRGGIGTASPQKDL